MSLETKIEALTLAVEKLTATLCKEPLQLESPLSVVTATTESLQQVKTGMSKEELQSGCLALVREDAANKSKIKAILAKFGVNVIADIPDDKLADFEAEVGKL